MSRIRRALPLLLMTSAIGAIVACSDPTAPAAPLSLPQSTTALDVDCDTMVPRCTFCWIVNGERICYYD